MATHEFTYWHDDLQNDSALQHTLGYIREFSEHAAAYQRGRSDDALLRLNRSMSLLSTTTQPHHFTAGCVETSKFFIDLYAVMTAVEAESDTIWSCISLLQHCSRNLDVRHSIVNDHCFVSMLGSLVRRIQRQERVYRVLLLLQELTYGIRITWEDPYIVCLVEYLIEIINTQDDDDEQSQPRLALSILVNLCYKNFVMIFLFLRSVNISNFSRRIQGFGLLANKMLIILSEDVQVLEPKELHVFLRTALASLHEAVKSWNVPYFCHIVEFLTESKSHHGLHQAMLSYVQYREDVERLLDCIDARTSMDDSNEESRRHQQICLGLFFRLIVYIFELEGSPNVSEEKNVISLDSINLRIFDMALLGIDSDICGVEATLLLDALLHLSKKDQLIQRIIRDPTIIELLVTVTEKPATKAAHTTVIVQLLLTLLQQPKIEKLILSRISESYFDKILSPLLSVKPETMNKHTIRQDETEKSVSCLHLLICFAEIAKKAYLDKCISLLEKKPVQYAMARAMTSGDYRLCLVVFKIAQFGHFPHEEVVRHIAALNASHRSEELLSSKNGTDEQWQNLNVILKHYRTFVNKDTEHRLSALIEVISNAQRKNRLQSVPTSQIIELYNYRIEAFSSSERSMQQRLNDASNQIAHYSQRLSLQNAELEKYHAMNFELHISQERLKTQSIDLKEQKDKLKGVMTDLLKQLAEQSEKFQVNEKILAAKSSQLTVLEKQNKELTSQISSVNADLGKLDASNKENLSRIEKLKKTINAYEQDIKEKLRTLDERERELMKTQKALEEQKEARKKADDLVSALETELQEKKEEIKNYELELSETEELRKTIMSLMESKKPKRKT